MVWPKVSIIVFADGDPGGCVRLLADCERLDQSTATFELIMVLQGLTRKVEHMLQEASFSFDISFIQVPPETNRAQGRNLGAKAARYEILLFLDSDLEIDPELVSQHAQQYADTDIAAVMGETYLPPFIKKSRWYRFLDSDYHRARRWATREKTHRSPPLRYVNTANFSVRRPVFEACGGHNQALTDHEAEDIDLAYRIHLLQQGVICFHPDARAYSQHHPFKVTLQAKFSFGRNGIPRLLSDYPELYPLLPSRFVQIDSFTGPGRIRCLLNRLLFNYPLSLLARVLRVFGPELLAFRVLRYLLQYESVRGVRAAYRKT